MSLVNYTGIGDLRRFWLSCLYPLVFLLLNTFAFQIFWLWWNFFQKRVVRTKLDIYVCITVVSCYTGEKRRVLRYDLILHVVTLSLHRYDLILHVVTLSLRRYDLILHVVTLSLRRYDHIMYTIHVVTLTSTCTAVWVPLRSLAKCGIPRY